MYLFIFSRTIYRPIPFDVQTYLNLDNSIVHRNDSYGVSLFIMRTGRTITKYDR